MTAAAPYYASAGQDVRDTEYQPEDSLQLSAEGALAHLQPCCYVDQI